MSRHRIGRQSVELRVGSVQEAHDLHAELSAGLLGRLSPVLGDIFDDACPAGVTVRIEALEIDAGVVSRDAIVEAVVERTRERLTALLRPLVTSGGTEWEELRRSGAADRIDLMTDEEVALEIVEAVLRYGALPSRHADVSRAEIDTHIEQLLARAPAALAALLRRLPPETTARRVRRQWSRPPRDRLLAVLGASSPESVESLVREWRVVLVAYQAARAAAAQEPQGSASVRTVSGPAEPPVKQSGAVSSQAEALPRAADPAPLPAGARLPAEEIETQLFEQAWRALIERQPLRVGERVAERALALVLGSAPAPSVAARVLAVMHDVARSQLAASSAVAVAVRERALVVARSIPPVPASREVVASGSTAGAGERAAEPSPEAPARVSATAASSVAAVSSLNDSRPHFSEGVATPHAGLVIAWPFLNGLFEACGLLAGKRFASEDARERAVLLLAHLADGRSEWSEPELVMEKVLCGCAADTPIAASIAVTEQERAEAHQVLTSILTHWAALKSTSIDGLRQAFLCRPGTTRQIASGWKVEIPRAGHDLLLDKLPWGIGLVMLPWMEQPLSVEW